MKRQGFIEDKRREEYREIWQQFIREEAKKWEEPEFPDALFEIFYKTYGLKQINPNSTKHPKFFAKLNSKIHLSVAAKFEWRYS